MFIYIVLLFIYVNCLFVYFYIKLSEKDSEIDEIYDMYYDLYNGQVSKDEKKIKEHKSIGKVIKF